MGAEQHDRWQGVFPTKCRGAFDFIMKENLSGGRREVWGTVSVFLDADRRERANAKKPSGGRRGFGMATSCERDEVVKVQTPAHFIIKENGSAKRGKLGRVAQLGIRLVKGRRSSRLRNLRFVVESLIV